MNYLADALAWLADPLHQAGPAGIWARTAEHLAYTFAATLLAALVGIPLGFAVGHTGRGRFLVVGGADRGIDAARAADQKLSLNFVVDVDVVVTL